VERTGDRKIDRFWKNKFPRFDVLPLHLPTLPKNPILEAISLHGPTGPPFIGVLILVA